MRYYILCIAKYAITKSWCFLRASGGVSNCTCEPFDGMAFSPRKRRCFHKPFICNSVKAVFSAQAEVFLSNLNHDEMDDGFLRASGGVSQKENYHKSTRPFSPRKRRCFRYKGGALLTKRVFSAQAEVFPRSLKLV